MLLYFTKRKCKKYWHRRGIWNGCALDYGLITCGERYGQIFICDVEYVFDLKAGSFQTFYQDWLNFILDTEQFKEELEMWRRLRNR